MGMLQIVFEKLFKVCETFHHEWKSEWGSKFPAISVCMEADAEIPRSWYRSVMQKYACMLLEGHMFLFIQDGK